LSELESTYRRYFPLIRAKCRRILGDADADDVSQETFVRLWRAGLAGADHLSVTAWIYRTSTRLAIDLLRQRQRRGAPETVAAMGELASVPPSAEHALQTRHEVEALARLLPSDELELALLHRIDGLTQAEIAGVMGVSARTVRRVLQRFHARVQTLRAVEETG
jgi:RNA polymerase sigma-70 factor (ECF subfamily)